MRTFGACVCFTLASYTSFLVGCWLGGLRFGGLHMHYARLFISSCLIPSKASTMSILFPENSSLIPRYLGSRLLKTGEVIFNAHSFVPVCFTDVLRTVPELYIFIVINCFHF